MPRCCSSAEEHKSGKGGLWAMHGYAWECLRESQQTDKLCDTRLSNMSNRCPRQRLYSYKWQGFTGIHALCRYSVNQLKQPVFHHRVSVAVFTVDDEKEGSRKWRPLLKNGTGSNFTVGTHHRTVNYTKVHEQNPSLELCSASVSSRHQPKRRIILRQEV